jgi:hypothetical protein
MRGFKMPTFKVDLPEHTYEFLKDLESKTGRKVDDLIEEAVVAVFGSDQSGMPTAHSREEAIAMVEASLAGPGASVAVNKEFWTEVDRRIDRYVVEAKQKRPKASA